MICHAIRPVGHMLGSIAVFVAPTYRAIQFSSIIQNARTPLKTRA